MNLRFSARVLLAACSLSIATIATASAQPGYPAQPVRIIVATAAGGPTDFMARTVSEILNKAGYETVVDNRGGAGGVLATHAVTKSEPNGYTLLIAHASPIVIHQSLLPEKPPYDVMKDLTPISHLTNIEIVAIVNPKVPVKTMAEFIAYAKARPGQLNFASTGTGNNPHLSGERFKLLTGTDLVHVPYNSSPQSITATLTGEAAFMFQTPEALELHKAGRLRALAITGKTRHPNGPDVPTMDEVGLPGFDSGGWYGLYGPAGLPKAVTMKLQSDVARGFAQPELREKLSKLGFTPVAGTPDELTEHMKTQAALWAELIKKANIRMK